MAERFLFRWRDAVLSDEGPESSTRRFVLVVLSVDANVDGSDCYPSTRRLATRTGLSRRSVEEHLRLAEEEGWVERRAQGEGQGWKRMIYTLTIPPEIRPRETGDDAGRSGPEEPPTPTPPRFPPLSALKRNGTARVYPPEFEGAFNALPARHVSHPKADAYKAWRARVEDVEELFQLEAAALAYAEECDREEKAGTKFVLMGSTFFGPGERWKPYSGLEAEPETSTNGGGAYVSRAALGAS